MNRTQFDVIGMSNSRRHRGGIESALRKTGQYY